MQNDTPVIMSNEFDLAIQFGDEPVVIEIAMSTHGRVPQMRIKASIQEGWPPEYIDWDCLNEDAPRYLNYSASTNLAPVVEQLRALVAFYDAAKKRQDHRAYGGHTNA